MQLGAELEVSGMGPRAVGETVTLVARRAEVPQLPVLARVEGEGANARLHFQGDSDAMIVRGLVAIALSLFDSKSAAEIEATDAEALFDRLDLRAHLTAQRSNGLRALVDRIKSDARRASLGSGQ